MTKELKEQIENFQINKEIPPVYLEKKNGRCRPFSAREIIKFKKYILELGSFTKRSVFVTEADLENKQEEEFRSHVPDSSIQELTFSHGFVACKSPQTCENVIENFKKILDAMNNKNVIEICCARENEKLGPVGIALKGQVSIAAKHDLCSKKRENGSRKCAWSLIDLLVTTADKLIPEKGYPYIEAWVNPQVIKYIWIQNNCSFKEEAAKYFKDLGYEVKIVA